MTAEAYLDQIKKIDFMIKNKLQEYQQWVEAAEGIGGASVGERVQATRNLHKSADAIGNYIDIEAEVKALKQKRQEIIETIEKLPSTEYDLIFKMYVQDYTMKELAYHFGKSYDTVKRWRNHALELIQAMLDEASA